MLKRSSSAFAAPIGNVLLNEEPGHRVKKAFNALGTGRSGDLCYPRSLEHAGWCSTLKNRFDGTLEYSLILGLVLDMASQMVPNVIVTWTFVFVAIPGLDPNLKITTLVKTSGPQ